MPRVRVIHSPPGRRLNWSSRDRRPVCACQRRDLSPAPRRHSERTGAWECGPDAGVGRVGVSSQVAPARTSSRGDHQTTQRFPVTALAERGAVVACKPVLVRWSTPTSAPAAESYRALPVYGCADFSSWSLIARTCSEFLDALGTVEDLRAACSVQVLRGPIWQVVR
jgi:hypothetical protein